VSDVARKMKLRVTAEGGDLEYNLSMIMDGQTGWEHAMGYAPTFDDVAKFFGLAGATYSPTFMVGGFSAWNEEFYYQDSEVWKDEKLTCYFSTPVVVGPHLYMVNGAATLRNPTITLRCVEAATGKVLWTKEKVGKYHAALVRTADEKLLMLDDAGNLILLQPDATAYKELCRAKVCGETWAHPAVSDGRVFVRDNKELVALKLN